MFLTCDGHGRVLIFFIDGESCGSCVASDGRCLFEPPTRRNTPGTRAECAGWLIDELVWAPGRPPQTVLAWSRVERARLAGRILSNSFHPPHKTKLTDCLLESCMATPLVCNFSHRSPAWSPAASSFTGFSPKVVPPASRGMGSSMDPKLQLMARMAERKMSEADSLASSATLATRGDSLEPRFVRPRTESQDWVSSRVRPSLHPLYQPPVATAPSLA